MRTLENPATAQALYFLTTGLWPLIHSRSFARVTGPKFEIWLVKTVGVLITVIAGVLFTAAVRRNVTFEVVLLAVGASLGLFGVDVFYVLRKRISPVYLADAALEAALLFFWAFEMER